VGSLGVPVGLPAVRFARGADRALFGWRCGCAWDEPLDERVLKVNRSWRVGFAALLIVVASSAAMAAERGQQVLSFPIGLLVGEIDVRVDLGPTAERAEVLLDGRRVVVPLFGEGVGGSLRGSKQKSDRFTLLAHVEQRYPKHPQHHIT